MEEEKAVKLKKKNRNHILVSDILEITEKDYDQITDIASNEIRNKNVILSTVNASKALYIKKIQENYC